MKTPRSTTPPATQPDTPERIAKVIARAGLCSRREAETWIADGRVALNGAVLTTPAVTVGPGDVVTIDGEPLPRRDRTRLWMFHKPRGLVTTTHDPEGRRTVFDVLPPDLPRVMTVGRLDINTEGLLLLTNDGGLARVMELPSTGWLRRYRVRAHGDIDQPRLDALRDGVAIDGVLYGAIEATVDRKQGANVWLTMGLREGKNREIKNILMHLGLDVTRLIRLSFGPFQLGSLAEGAVEEVPRKHLKDQLGEALAAAAGVDLDVREDDRKPKMPPRRASPLEAPEGPARDRPGPGGRAKQSGGKRRPEPSGQPVRHATGRGAGPTEAAARPASKARGHRPDAARSRRRHEADVDHNAGVEAPRRRPTLALKGGPDHAQRSPPPDRDGPRGQKSRRDMAESRRGGTARAEAVVERKPRKAREAGDEATRSRGNRQAGPADGGRPAERKGRGGGPTGGKHGGHRSAGSAGDRPTGGKHGGHRSAGSAGDRPTGGHRSGGAPGGGLSRSPKRPGGDGGGQGVGRPSKPGGGPAGRGPDGRGPAGRGPGGRGADRRR